MLEFPALRLSAVTDYTYLQDLAVYRPAGEFVAIREL